MTNNNLPQLIIKNDFDGYFESLVKSWIERKKTDFKHSKIVVTDEPWRPYTVSYEIHEDTINLDFYSALRRGFGELSSKEITEIIELL